MPDSFATLEVTEIQNILDSIQCNEQGNAVFKAEIKCIAQQVKPVFNWKSHKSETISQ